MNTLAPSSNRIWILLGVGLVMRLVAYFVFASSYNEAADMWWIIIACDIAIGYIIYLLAGKVFASSSKPMDNEADKTELADTEEVDSPTPARDGWPLVMAALWLLNPAAVFISSSLGFMEPILVLFMVLALVLLRDKLFSAVLVLMLPVFFQLRAWLVRPDYGSISAFNFFALIGGIDRPLDTFFLGFVYYLWGAVLVLGIVAGAALLIYKDMQTGGRNYFFIIGAYFILLFVFSTGMEARALFPGLVFLLLYFVERRDGRVLGLYLAFSATLLINLYQMRGMGGYYFRFPSDFMILASTANVILAIVMAILLINAIWPNFKLLAPPGTDREGIPVRYYVWILLAIGFLVRVIIVVHIDYSFGFDVGLFKTWAINLHQHGLASYCPYGEARIVAGYAPVYLYVLYFLGWLKSVFEWERGSHIFVFLIFLPAIICDLGIGYILHRRADKSQRPTSRVHIPTLLAVFWILNPAVILISSVWGQVESVFVLPLMLSVLLLRDKKLLGAYLLFVIAILTKPQSLFLAPVYLFSAIEYFQEKKVSLKSVGQFSAYIAGALGLMVLIFIPFGFRTAVGAFWEGLGLRPFATVNAFNFFALVGGNWRPLHYRFIGLSYGFIGMIIIIVLIVGTIGALYFDRKRGGQHYFLVVGGLLALLYIFSFRMLDRYMFPALPFLILHVMERRDRRVLGIYFGLSATFFFNCYELLRWARHGHIRYDVMRSVAVINVALGSFLLYLIITSVWGKARARE